MMNLLIYPRKDVAEASCFKINEERLIQAILRPQIIFQVKYKNGNDDVNPSAPVNSTLCDQFLHHSWDKLLFMIDSEEEASATSLLGYVSRFIIYAALKNHF